MQKREDAHEHLREVLTHYGWQLPPVRTGWVTVKCYAHDDGHASCRINYDIGAVHCMACDLSGDVYAVIIHYEGGGFRESLARFEDIVGGGGRSVRDTNQRGSRLPRRTGYHRAGSETLPSRLRGGTRDRA